MFILCEKFSVAESFSKALDGKKEKGFYSLPDGSVITYCAGHLYEQAKPVYYFPENDKSWSLDKLPVIPEKFVYLKRDDAGFQISVINRLLKEHQNDRIIIATDADREGELIARIVLSQSHVNLSSASIFRFWSSEALTKDVILKEMGNMKTWSKYDFLALQGYSRQRADWLYGMNLTMYLSLLNNNMIFNVGRVMTAILALISRRNKDIENFVPKPYLELQLTMKDNAGSEVKALLINPQTKETAFSPDSDYIKNALEYYKLDPKISAEATINPRSQKPPKLPSLTELSKVCADRFDLSAQNTLNIVQKLYEEYKCVSYPRTPSSVMGDDDVDLFMKKFRLLKDTCRLSQYSNVENIRMENKHIFNSRLLEAHHALIPLDVIPPAASLIEKQVYAVILNRFFISCMNDRKYDEIQYIFKNGNFFYKAGVSVTTEPGWTVISKSDSDDSTKKLNLSEAFPQGLKPLKKMTEPKKHFTESTLLAFMKNPRNQDENRKLVGLGTEATRGEIIQKLQDCGYIEKRNKKFFTTQKGEHLMRILESSPELKKLGDIEQTTIWEEKLAAKPEEFVREITAFVSSTVSKKIEVAAYKGEVLSQCPYCKKGNCYSKKFSYMCDNESCGFKLNKSFCGSEINEYEFKILMAGKTTRLKAFKKKSGEKFKSKIKFSFADKKIIFTK